MHITPQRLSQLLGGDNLTGVSCEQAEGGQFSWGQVNYRFTAKESAVGLKPEPSKGERRLATFATWICRRVGTGCLVAR
jgi:hypothetical protein